MKKCIFHSENGQTFPVNLKYWSIHPLWYSSDCLEYSNWIKMKLLFIYRYRKLMRVIISHKFTWRVHFRQKLSKNIQKWNLNLKDLYFKWCFRAISTISPFTELQTRKSHTFQSKPIHQTLRRLAPNLHQISIHSCTR